MTWLPPLLRVLAIAIAVVAAIDPSMALTRAERVSIGVIDAGGTAATSEMSRRLAEWADVSQGAIAGAAATVIVGDELPGMPVVISGTLFAVTPPSSSPRIDIESVSAPALSPSGSKIPVAVRARAVGLRGRSITAELFAGSLAVDSLSRKVTADVERVDVMLAMPPSGAGLASARVVIRDSADQSLMSERRVIVDVRDRRWRVLVADPRPSWSSTFIRRVLEGDRRFDVASRVGTSKNVRVESGAAPALTDAAGISPFDVIIIGAPDALSGAEVRSLDRYARERGGSVVLLLDHAGLGLASTLVSDVTVTAVRRIERAKATGAAGTLVATEFAVPRGPGLVPLAEMSVDGAAAPVVWSSAVGAGRIIINGALDAWKYRARENGGFAAFWADAIGAAAGASPAALTLDTETLRVAPGATFDVRAIVRDAQLSDPSRPSPAVELAGPPDFWPAAERGVFHAPVNAPETAGVYRIEVDGAVLNYVVAPADRRPAPELLAAWTTSRGGTVINDDVSDAVSRIRASVNAQNARVETHPMRSIWWLPAFVFLTGAEWWMRRRRGAR